MHWVPSQREAVARSGLDPRAPCKLGFRQSAVAWIVAVTIVGLLVGTILIVGGLTFFPALALGPVVEHLVMIAGQTF